MSDAFLPLIHSRVSIDQTYTDSLAYFKENPKLKEQVWDIYWSLHYLWDVVPQTVETMFSPHTFPAMEANNEFDASVALLLEGFYRQSIVSLRSVLELSLLSVFYNQDDNGHDNIQAWAHGAENTPFMKTIKKELGLLPYFSEFDTKFTFFDGLDEIYGILNDFTHIKGHRHSARGLARRSNTNNFDKSAFARWLYLAKRVVKVAVIIHGLRFPLMLKVLPLEDKFGFDIPSGFFLSESQIDQVKKSLTKEEIAFIEEKAEHDDYTIAVTNDILSRPDMTKAELRKQSLDFNKSMISHSPTGFKGWYESHSGFYKDSSQEVRDSFEKEAAVLKRWAKRNKCLESHIAQEGI
ncbi:MAG: hypothetical protein JWO96_455 [Candidatus Saccharibacteria bacterium]|nr:hypothetical protein [Candidatus Saccharibacteria bacterium]